MMMVKPTMSISMIKKINPRARFLADGLAKIDVLDDSVAFIIRILTQKINIFVNKILFW